MRFEALYYVCTTFVIKTYSEGGWGPLVCLFLFLFSIITLTDTFLNVIVYFIYIYVKNNKNNNIINNNDNNKEEKKRKRRSSPSPLKNTFV